MRRLVLAILLLCLAFAASAGARRLADGFGERGVVYTNFGAHQDLRSSEAGDVAVAPDGRILLGIAAGESAFTVERLTAGGTLDPGFGDGGAVATAIEAQAMAPTSEDGVVVAGSSGGGLPGRDIAVSRYGPDGRIDAGFGHRGTVRIDLGLEDFAEAVGLAPDGSIVVAGQTRCPARRPGCGYYTRTEVVLLRLGPDGGLLHRARYRTAAVSLGLAIDPQGEIFVAAEPVRSGLPAELIAFGPNGGLRRGFGKKGVVEIAGDRLASTLAAAGSGDDLLLGSRQPSGDLRRLLANGSPDLSFGAKGLASCPPADPSYFGEAPTRIAPVGDGDVLVSGGRGNCGLVRYLPDGTLDPGFGTGGGVSSETLLGGPIENLAAGPDGSAVVVRPQGGSGLSLARYDASGALDPGFGTSGLASVPVVAATNDRLSALVALPHRGLLAVGTRDCADHSCGEFALARYRADGGLDRTFGDGGLVSAPIEGDGVATSAAIERDGGIVVGGTIGVRAAGELHQKRLALARYAPNGMLDTGFGRDGIVTVPDAKKGEDVQINSVAIAPDGDIVAAGEASCSESTECGKHTCGECGAFVVARVHPDGSLDRGFGRRGVLRIDVGRNEEDHDSARAVAIEPDGKIVIAGHSYGGFALVRLLPDGRRDRSFGQRGIARNRFSVAGRGEDGKPFEVEVSRTAEALALLPGGKILVGGGNEVRYLPGFPDPVDKGLLVRYRPDGTVDTSFGGDGLVDVEGVAIRSLAVDGCGRALVAGPFRRHSRTSSFGAARVLPSGRLDRSFGGDGIFHLGLGTGQDSSADALALSGDRVVLGGTSGKDGAGADFTLAALPAGACHR